MITRRERASAMGLGVGARVRFEFEGQRLSGFINRVTKRATVLVESPDGRRFSDGRHYRSYYVPIGALEPAEA
jgi:hypothetical protein